MAFTLSAAVSFIACHGGAAYHFAAYAQHLTQQGYEVQVYASGPAATKFISCGVQPQYEFLLDDANAPTQVAEELALRCQSAAVVITDVGHAFCADVQAAWAQLAPRVMRLHYQRGTESA